MRISNKTGQNPCLPAGASREGWSKHILQTHTRFGRFPSTLEEDMAAAKIQIAPEEWKKIEAAD
jgi:hypothetical protein